MGGRSTSFEVAYGPQEPSSGPNRAVVRLNDPHLEHCYQSWTPHHERHRDSPVCFKRGLIMGFETQLGEQVAERPENLWPGEMKP